MIVIPALSLLAAWFSDRTRTWRELEVTHYAPYVLPDGVTLTDPQRRLVAEMQEDPKGISWGWDHEDDLGSWRRVARSLEDKHLVVRGAGGESYRLHRPHELAQLFGPRYRPSD